MKAGTPARPFSASRRIDVVVIGGGHAGTEAAAVAARYGCETLLITHRWDTVGAMSCNPAIGGLGKGHLVREVDALDGIMARAIDRGGIQFRVLNRRKGPAVRGPRAQADRRLYAEAVKALLMEQPGLSVLEDEVSDVCIEDGRVCAVATLGGREIRCGAVVVTSGTFLRGMIHVGRERVAAGRIDERPAVALARRFEALGLIGGRLKTGTPARLDGRTIAWRKLEMQAGDDPPEPFSALTTAITTPQIACGITRTTPDMHRLIRESLDQSALYGGMISGRGPRYCPSIEDKVVRFADRESHQVFLEPEGLDDPTVYPNGLSTSLPAAVQERFLRMMPGLEDVIVLRHGYAIEYDHCDPRRLWPSLETRSIAGLFLAGQINGTTGYEEAAAQGVLAGANAARRAAGAEPVAMSRAESYTGVMIDDLTRDGVTEPYRMFTSRSEFRLALRADNADERLTSWGDRLGIVGSARRAWHGETERRLSAHRDRLSAFTVTPQQAERAGIVVNHDGRRRSAFELLSMPDVDWIAVGRLDPSLVPERADDRARIETDAKYAVYLARQEQDWDRLNRDRDLSLMEMRDFRAVAGLSNELREKLESIRPRNVEEASRIEGMTPAALALLARHAQRRISRAADRDNDADAA
jgi:tRNA uridine 5-carboxymethylaminomethyl modification enzyme